MYKRENTYLCLHNFYTLSNEAHRMCKGQIKQYKKRKESFDTRYQIIRGLLILCLHVDCQYLLYFRILMVTPK